MVLNSEILISHFQDINGKFSLCLKEDGSDAKLKHVKIVDVPSPLICYKLQSTDKINNSYLDLKSSLGFNKGCDGIILYLKNDKIKPIFCELKSRTITPKEYEFQIICSELFTNYLKEIVTNIFKTKITFDKPKYILFHRLKENERVNKQATRPKPSSKIENIPMTHFNGKYIKRIGFNEEKVDIKFSCL